MARLRIEGYNGRSACAQHAGRRLGRSLGQPALAGPPGGGEADRQRGDETGALRPGFGSSRSDRPDLSALRQHGRRDRGRGSRTFIVGSISRTSDICSVSWWPRSLEPAAGAASGQSRTSITTGSQARPHRLPQPSPRRRPGTPGFAPGSDELEAWKLVGPATTRFPREAASAPIAAVRSRRRATRRRASTSKRTVMNRESDATPSRRLCANHRATVTSCLV